MAAAFMEAASTAVAFVAVDGEAAGEAAAGVTVAQVGAGGVVGAAVGIAAGVGGWQLARSSARPLLILIMATAMETHPTALATVTATVRVAGSGGASGPLAAVILAGGVSTFATDRLPAVSSDDLVQIKVSETIKHDLPS
jgi:hypothetical protein